MVLSEKDAERIKSQLLKQVDKFPEESRDKIVAQIKSMSNEQLEEFVKQNDLGGSAEAECIFCSIVSGKVESFKIIENEKAVAVLEINPISRGHILIVPKNHEGGIEDVKDVSVFISNKISELLKPKEIKIIETKVMGHFVLNVVPIYEGTDINKRMKADEKELKELSDLFLSSINKKVEVEEEQEIKEVKKEEKKEVVDDLPKFRARIPK